MSSAVSSVQHIVYLERVGLLSPFVSTDLIAATVIPESGI